MTMMFQDNNNNIMGYDNNNNAFSSSSVVANKDGSIIERIEQLLIDRGGVSYGGGNSGSVAITFAAGTTGSVATHEILTVTGLVRIRMIAVCSTNVAGTGSIQLGTEDATNGWIASTTGTDIDAGEIWIDATPTETNGNYSTLVLDKVVNGVDVGYEVTANTLTGGVVTFYYWWEPLNSTGAVVAADGTGALV